MLGKINVSITNRKDFNELIDILHSKGYTWIGGLKLKERNSCMSTITYSMRYYDIIYINISDDKTISWLARCKNNTPITFKEYKRKYCKKEYTFNIKIK